MKCARHADRLWARHHPPREPTGWVIPEAIVMCESSGQNLPPNSATASGYYQITDGTWPEGGGGPPNEAWRHPKAEQDRVAANLWAGGAGAGRWVCKA